MLRGCRVYDPRCAALLLRWFSGESGFEYLLEQRLAALTRERLTQLRAELADAEGRLSWLQQQRPEDLWLADLDALAAHISKVNDWLRKHADPALAQMPGYAA